MGERERGGGAGGRESLYIFEQTNKIDYVFFFVFCFPFHLMLILTSAELFSSNFLFCSPRPENKRFTTVNVCLHSIHTKNRIGKNEKTHENCYLRLVLNHNMSRKMESGF